MPQQAHERFGRLDILVNNAAFQEHAEKLTDLTEDRFDQTMKTNVYGYFHMAKAVLPYLKRGASIINTGSVTGLEGSNICSTMPPPRARSMRSPSRWPPTCWSKASASTRWRRGRCGRRSIPPMRRRRRSRSSAPIPT
jgi:NAD(P)-dependent dehydrogenase (short-subunit alcohol dehydrogenase family)